MGCAYQGFSATRHVGTIDNEDDLRFSALKFDSAAVKGSRLRRLRQRRTRTINTQYVPTAIPSNNWSIMAASGFPPSLERSTKPNFSIPMPPPPLHTRSGNEYLDSPHTPTQMAFTSPFSTPQGSPSKNKLPPGANDLPDVFENAMKLEPSTPTAGRQSWLRAHLPNKSGKQAADETFEESTVQQGYSSGSPTRKSNKENTTPGVRLPKETTYPITQAAKSRQEPYRYKETFEPPTRGRYNFQRGLTPEELEKLQLPKVKRLANVTQLCETNHPGGDPFIGN